MVCKMHEFVDEIRLVEITCQGTQLLIGGQATTDKKSKLIKNKETLRLDVDQ